MKLLSRILTAAVLIALAVTAGVWLAHPPLAAATGHPTKIIREPAGAPLPIPAPISAVPIARPTTPLIIEVPVEVEIAAPAAAVSKPPAIKSNEPTPQPQPACQPRRARFRRR